MFTRQVFRPARSLAQNIRHYSSEPPKPQSGGSFLRTALIVGAFSAGGYYYYTNYYDTKNLKAKAALPASKIFTGGDQGFVSLRLDTIENINHNTKKFRFVFDDPNAVSGLNIASALLTKYQAPNMEKPLVRPYTPISDEDTTGYLDLLIKRYEGGPMSTHLHEMAPGQRLDFKGPLPKYAWSTNKHEHIALVAGGTGITPMYQLCRAIFNNPADNTKVSLIFGNVTEGDILLKEELAKLENDYPNRFKAFYVLDKPPADWMQPKGFITKDLLKTVLPPPDQGEKIKIFVCGPPGMYKAISGGKKSPADQGELSGMLQELGYTKDQVYKF